MICKESTAYQSGKDSVSAVAVIKGTCTIQRPHAILNTSDSEIMISEQSDWSVV